MCGIFGFAGPPSKQAALLAQALAIADETRGTDSTGYAVRFRHTVRLVKRAVRGRLFVAQRLMKPLFAAPWTMMIGHNRFATAGGVTDRNSHPFRVKLRDGSGAYAVHNGVVPSAELSARFGVPAAAVDSETYFRAIAARADGTERSLLAAIGEVTRVADRSGNLAILWMQPRPRRLYAWRTSRPLEIVDARRAGLGRWFASEWEIFRGAWQSLGAALPPLGGLKHFTARAGTIYRVADDRRCEVEAVGPLGIPPPTPSRYFPRRHATLWDDAWNPTAAAGGVATAEPPDEGDEPPAVADGEAA